MLTDLSCKSLISQSIRLGRPIKKADGNALFLYAKPKGKAYWRFKYRLQGKKENLMSFGAYPFVSLSEARARHEEAYRQVLKGNDPVQLRQEEQRQAERQNANSFAIVGRAWHSHNIAKWSASHAAEILRNLEKDLFALIGHIPVTQLTRKQLLEALQTIENRSPEMARRSLQFSGCILRYARNQEYTAVNIALDLEGVLRPFKKGHHPSMDIEELPAFLRKLNSDTELSETMRDALYLCMLTLVRRGELLKAQWSEFDLNKSMWVIPAHRMKMRREHMVPLSRQVIKLLVKRKRANDLLHGIDRSPYIFPSYGDANKPMNNKSIGLALHHLGYKDKHTAHGFRALGMGIAKEKLDYSHEVPDRQLAHVPASEVDRAYDRGKYLSKRIKMMQELADYIDRIS